MNRIIQSFVDLSERVFAGMVAKSHKKPQRVEFLFTDQSERELILSELHTF
jgi:hypothetical protein